MTTDDNHDSTLEAVEGLLARMEALLDRMEGEVRTRRLVVVDEDNQERIVLDAGPFMVGGSFIHGTRFDMKNHHGDDLISAHINDGGLTEFTVSTGRMVHGEINTAAFVVACTDEPESVGDSHEPHVLVATVDAYNHWDNISDTLAESLQPVEERGHQRQVSVLRACVSELMQAIEPVAD